MLLVGRDLPEAHHVFEQLIGPKDSPFAQRLGLGWVVIDDVCTGKIHKPDKVSVLKTRILDGGRPTIPPQCDHEFVVKQTSCSLENRQNDHAEVASALRDSEECWYLPVFGVYHPKKKDQIRAVFDSSLNSVLLSGPDLINSLVGILMRFRKCAVGLTGDIQQMFDQFRVHERDINYLRFFLV